MKKSLKNKHILITAGPTQEPLDPVRHLSNLSSGVMGYSLASQLRKEGAKVTLISGPTNQKPPKSVKAIFVKTAKQMYAKVKSLVSGSDVFIGTAAVSDYRPLKINKQKIKKNKEKVTLDLVKNPDILATVGKYKRKKRSMLLIGFALETHRLKDNALKKMKKKNADLFVGNSPVSFGSKKIKPLWVEREGQLKQLPSMSKVDLSKRISSWIKTRI